MMLPRLMAKFRPRKQGSTHSAASLPQPAALLAPLLAPKQDPAISPALSSAQAAVGPSLQVFCPLFLKHFFFFIKANKIQPCLQSRDHLSQAQLSTRNKLIRLRSPLPFSCTGEEKSCSADHDEAAMRTSSHAPPATQLSEACHRITCGP